MWSCGVVAAVLRRETFERACVLGKWFPSLRSLHATGHLPATRDSNIQTYPHILIVAPLSCSLNSLSFCFDILHPLLILSQFVRNLYNFPILSARIHYTTQTSAHYHRNARKNCSNNLAVPQERWKKHFGGVAREQTEPVDS